MTRERDASLRRIPIRLIDPSPFRIRQDLRAFELGASMRRRGILSPIKVRPKPNGRYEVVFGDRRLHEAKRLGFNKIGAIVEDVNDRQALIDHCIENLSRKSLNAIEEANAFWRLKKEAKFETQQIAKLIGKTPGFVSNRLVLLQLPEKAQRWIASGELGPGIANRIAQTIPPQAHEKVASSIVERKLDVYQALSYLKSLAGAYEAVELGRRHELQERHARAGIKKVFPSEEAKPSSKRELEEIRKRTEKRLQESFGFDSVDICSLQFWRLLLTSEPKLQQYRIRVKKDAFLHALQSDLERLKRSDKLVAVAAEAS